MTIEEIRKLYDAFKAEEPGYWPSDAHVCHLLRVFPKMLGVVEAVKAVKAAHFGPMFWECDAGPLEHLDDALAELESSP